MAQPNSYKTHRQLVHCRIDVETPRRNVVVTRHISYKTRRQLVHCRIDVVTTQRNVVVNPLYLGMIPYYVAASRTGSVITHTLSPWSTGGPEHARTYDNRRNVYENYTTIYGRVTRSVREELRPLWTPSCGEIFKPFKNPVGSSRQCRRYGDMLREQPI